MASFDQPRRPPEPQPEPSTTRPITVVTGGSEGIGLAIAHRFAARGHCLLLIARGRDRLLAAAAELKARHGGEVHVLALDLTTTNATHEIDATLEGLGRHVEILVNNAGLGISGLFDEADAHKLDELVALNVAVPSRLIRHLLPGMRARRSGGILNVASLGGYVPGPFQAAYYASKAYLISLSEAVAAEVRADGVRVTVVAPGPVATRFHAKMGAESAFYRRFLPSASPENVAAWAMMGFDLGLRVVVPGFINVVGFVALWLLPHAILVPIVAVLLRVRDYARKGTSENA